MLTGAAAAALLSAAPAAASGASSWGDNEQGQLGNGGTTRTDLAGPVAGLEGGIEAISAGSNHNLALLSSGAVMAWGDNGSGELGDGTMSGPETCPSGFSTTACSTTPVQTMGLGGVRAISAGGGMSLALLSNGTVMAWGSNYAGSLGNGSTANSDTPVPVSGLRHVQAISANGPHSLALLRNGKVMAWGDNEYGQLGDGTHTGPEICPSAGFSTVPCSKVPVPVSGLRNVIAISAGDDHNLALLNDGTVVAWGVNNDGQLGDGSTTDSDVPVAVHKLSGVSAISAGGFHSLALLSDGTVASWGDNGNGQLGNGTLLNGTEPAPVSGLSEVTTISAGLAHSLAVLVDGTAKAWGWNEEGQLGNGTPKGESTLPTPVVGLSGVSVVSAGGYHSLAAGLQPAVFKVKPTKGPASGGTSVTITGANFTGTTSVRFGSTAASSYTIESPTRIRAVSPAEPAAKVDVTVTTSSGTSPVNKHDRFTFKA
jgi:alpha-tubulin suppressor-like RCC1 family protein